MARIHHIATRNDWDDTRASGTYTTSTYGKTLAEEGFIHACTRDQVRPVFERYYRGVREPLVLMTIDTDRLTGAEVREEVVAGETYPHVHGPINRSAIVGVEPLNRQGGTDSFLMTVIRDMSHRMFWATLAMTGVMVVLLLLVWAQGR